MTDIETYVLQEILTHPFPKEQWGFAINDTLEEVGLLELPPPTECPLV